jgi:hypothetical protein
MSPLSKRTVVPLVLVHHGIYKQIASSVRVRTRIRAHVTSNLSRLGLLVPLLTAHYQRCGVSVCWNATAATLGGLVRTYEHVYHHSFAAAAGSEQVGIVPLVANAADQYTRVSRPSSVDTCTRAPVRRRSAHKLPTPPSSCNSGWLTSGCERSCDRILAFLHNASGARKQYHQRQHHQQDQHVFRPSRDQSFSSARSRVGSSTSDKFIQQARDCRARIPIVHRRRQVVPRTGIGHFPRLPAPFHMPVLQPT